MQTIGLLTTGFVLTLAGLSLQKRWEGLRYLAPRLLVMTFSMLLILGLGEVYFRYVYAESGWGFTLAYQNWEQRYWRTNALGFRDREWTPEDWQGKTTVMIMGDSFSAGWGIPNPEDRYGDVLAELLGNGYAVVNASRPGGTPPRELAWARAHPLQNPDIIIYQYYMNDIDDAALSIGDQWYPQFPEPPRWIHKESYLANFLYWRIVPLLTSVNASDGQSYWEWNDATYMNSVIFEIHHMELHAIMDYSQAVGARMIVVIFPNLQNPASSAGHVDGVISVFQDRGFMEILNLTPEAAAWQTSDRVVSSRDAHPSAAFQHRVGELLYQNFFADDAAP